MPAQPGKSSLSAKYGAKLDAAAQKHAGDPVDRGFQSLPGGIRNGVAKLAVCGFFTYDANTKQKKSDGKSAVGELYFRAAAVVFSPTHVTVDGAVIGVKGQQTSIMEPICETKNSKGLTISVEDHVKEVQNYLKLLGASPESLGSGEEIEATAAALQQQAPFISFSTSQGKATKEYPDPRVFENWHGLAEGFVPEGGDPATSGVADAGDPTDGGGGSLDVSSSAPSGDDDHLDDLAVKGDAKPPDADACDELKKIALEAGVDDDAVASADNWASVVVLIREAREGSGGAAPKADEPPAEPEFEPKKGEPYRLVIKGKDGKPLKGKTGRVVKHDVEVTAVDKKSKTVNLKDLEDGKSVYKGVAWGDLEDHA